MPKEIEVHGDTRTDNYFWLRDRSDPDTIPYLEAENAYTKTMMRHTEELQASLYAEMLSHIKQTDLTVPVKRDEYFYYTRTEEGKQYRIYCRKSGSLDAAEEILLDGNAMAEGQKYFQIGAFAPSPNHKLLAYSIDLTGDEIFTVSIKNLETGEVSADEIHKTSYSLEWAEPITRRCFTRCSTAPSGLTKCFGTGWATSRETPRFSMSPISASNWMFRRLPAALIF